MIDEPTSPRSRAPTRDADPTTGNRPPDAPRLPPVNAPIPESFGRYRVLRLIGEGGMGTVYLAEQENPRRAVALKVIRPGSMSAQALKRFEFESAVLGRLQHPGIAQVYEAGVFARPGVESIPFFAMEFIKGVPLTEFAASRKLGTRERLTLVAMVCDAVYHAHQKGVIHRDLKPGNILVDESGQPKILDFGVARATDSDVQQTTIQTDIGAIIGTVPYMSPEQVGGDPAELDTRSDVYALGVIAYELLAGRLPHDLRRKMIHEAARIIREEEPTRLSSINRTLRGDVETIVAKAIEKEKPRRYQSAEALASDIRRYLKHEPIAARPASGWYQASKFARRNRGLVTGVAAAFVLLVAGLAGTGHGLKRAVESRDKERAARDEAELQKNAALAAERAEKVQRQLAEAQRDKAEKIGEFMSDTLEGAGPSVARGRDATMLKEMMDSAAARIEHGDLKDAPEAELRLRNTIGGVYVDLSRLDEALRILEPALPLARSLYPGDHEDTADTLTNLGLTLDQRGDFESAERLTREYLDMRRRLAPGDDLNVSAALNNLAHALARREDFEGAEALYRESLDMMRRLYPEGHPEIAETMASLGVTLQDLSRFDEAEAVMREALTLSTAAYNGDHPNTAVCMHNLAGVLQERGEFAEAESLRRGAVAMARRLFGNEHVITATGLCDLAGLLIASGDVKGGEAVAQESLDMFRRVHRGDHIDIAKVLALRAKARFESGDYTSAESLMREAVDTRRRAQPGDNLELASDIGALGVLAWRRGDLAEAEATCRESVAMLRRLVPGDHPYIAGALNNLGTLLQECGKGEESESLLRETLEMYRRLFPGDHPDVASSLNNLSNQVRERGRFDEAVALAEESLAMWRRMEGGDLPGVAAAVNTLGKAFEARGEFARAEPCYAEALALCRRTLPERHDNTLASLGNLAVTLEALGRPSEAEPLRRELLDARTAKLPEGDWRIGESRFRLGIAVARQGRFAEAEAAMLKAHREITSAPDAPAILAARACEALNLLYTLWDKAEPGKGHDAAAAEWKAKAESIPPQGAPAGGG